MEAIALKVCTWKIAYQVSQFGSKANAASVYNFAISVAISAYSALRTRRSCFNKYKFTEKLLHEYPNINPTALEYLHFKGKLELTIEDFEMHDTFLNNLIKSGKKWQFAVLVILSINDY